MIKGTMEWSSKCVTIEDGLIRLFGPPPECDEIDRIDLARGELTVSKKVVEGKDEDGNKMYFARVQIKFGEESSSSVHVVTSSQKEDVLTRSDSLSSLARVIKDADERNKAPTPRAREDTVVIEAGGHTVSISSNTAAEAQAWLRALQKEVDTLRKEKRGDNANVVTLASMPPSKKSSDKSLNFVQPHVDGRSSKDSTQYKMFPPPSVMEHGTETVLDAEIGLDRATQVHTWLQHRSKWTSTDNDFAEGSEIQFLVGSRPLPPWDGGLPGRLTPDSDHAAANTWEEEEALCFKTHVCCEGNVADALLDTILTMSSFNHQGPFKHTELLRPIDEDTDLLLIQYAEPHGSTIPHGRDMCVRRGWKRLNDGNILVHLDSAFPFDGAPAPTRGCERLDINAAYLISPLNDETMLTLVCQLECKDDWSRARCIEEIVAWRHHVVNLSEALELKSLSKLSVFERDARDAAEEGEESAKTIHNSPYPPTCPKHMVAEPSGRTFSLRDVTYLVDRVKAPSEDSVFKLCCVDIFNSFEKTVDICSRSDNRVAMSRKRGDDTWYFVMNIMVPLKKKKTFSFVVYWEGDREKVDEDSPFGRIARPFFNNDDDNYRNSRFKLIPRVVQGPYVVRMAVGEKPALLGNKLTQHYTRGDNYFEIDIDVSSSVIANNTVGMCLSSSRSIRVDMGITLQGETEEELPEIMLAAITGVKVDTSMARLIPNRGEL